MYMCECVRVCTCVHVCVLKVGERRVEGEGVRR